MNVALWIVAVLLAAIFLGAGTAKLIVSGEKLAVFVAWGRFGPHTFIG